MNFLKRIFFAFCTLCLHTTFANTELNFIPISVGEFEMGSPDNEDGRRDNENLHQVNLVHHFEIGETEVTQRLYFELTGINPSFFNKREHCPDTHTIVTRGVELCPNHPVEQVRWYEVQDFIKEFNRRNDDGYTYRLPTEAEWEYAARAGTTMAWFFGENSFALGNYAWFKGNSGEQTHSVRSREPNLWGLYDMYGNVSEWVQDDYTDFLVGGTDPLFIGNRRFRVARGGSWNHSAFNLRSASRVKEDVSYNYNNVGFRLVRVKETVYSIHLQIDNR